MALVLNEMKAMTTEHDRDRGATTVETGLAGGDVFLSVKVPGQHGSATAMSQGQAKELARRIMWLSERAQVGSDA